MLMGTGNALLTASARTVGPKLGPGSTCLKTDMGSVRVVAFIPPRDFTSFNLVRGLQFLKCSTLDALSI